MYEFSNYLRGYDRFRQNIQNQNEMILITSPSEDKMTFFNMILRLHLKKA